jgi:predicted ATPase
MLRLLAARAARASKRRAAHHHLSSSSSSDTPTRGPGIEAAYKAALESGALLPDASQQRAVESLALLQAAVVERSRRRRAPRAAAAADGEQRPPPQRPGAPPPPPPPPPPCLGAYLWGDVGTGKTALADLFLRSLPPDVPRRRAHFHAFMLAYHRRQHELLAALPRVAAPTRQGGREGGMRVWRSALPDEDPILTAAREIALCGGGGGGGGGGAGGDALLTPAPSPPRRPRRPLAVLCLDELHVADVADAMALARLFSALLERHGVAVLFTSNRPPWRLYEGGLSRKFFLPFVRTCEDRLIGLRVGGEGGGGGDYRRQRRSSSSSSSGGGGGGGGGGGSAAFVGPGAAGAFERAWGEEVGGRRRLEDARAFRLPVPAAGRDLVVPRALLLLDDAGGGSAGAPQPQPPPPPRLSAARFSFDELCGPGAALSSADYCALVGALGSGGGGGGGGGALFVSGVPSTLDPRRRRDEARRLVTLLDVVCDAKARAEADGPPPRLVLEIDGDAAAAERGLDSIFDALSRERAAAAAAAAKGEDRPGAEEDDDEDGGAPPSLYAEEALMYRRAASRLAGLCEVEFAAAAGAAAAAAAAGGEEEAAR